MLKRDSLTAQMQQFSHTLAKVKRLIVENKMEDAVNTGQDALTAYFGTSITDLLETPVNLFRQHLTKNGYQPEELGMLADFLDTLAGINEKDAERSLIWRKVLLIYDMLEQEYKVVSFAHLARRVEILDVLENEP